MFKALNSVEITLLLVLSAACYAAGTGTGALILLGCLAAVLTIQVGVVRPPLSKRSDRVLAGQTAPRSRTHWVYVTLEVAKVGLLIGLAFDLAAEVVPWVT